ncbi:MAG TPA: prepilin-type N-terminal cleavage/methylation domain-containing protein [Thermoanaerobaculia bacterium]
MEFRLVDREKAEARATSPEAGFSMIEALIAAAILLIIALGLIPLFTRSILDNNSGNDATQATNHGKTRLEDLIQIPFNHQRLDVPAGSQVGQSVETWTSGALNRAGDANERWWDGATPPVGSGEVLWTRTTRVRQFSVNDLDDGVLDNPQPGGTQPIFVQLKELEVQLENGKRGTLLGGSQALTVRVVKPF